MWRCGQSRCSTRLGVTVRWFSLFARRRIALLCAVVAGSACAAEPDEEQDQSSSLSLSLVKDLDLEGGDGPPVLWAWGLAVDAEGNLFVLDRVTRHLRKYSAAGGYLATVSGPDGEAVVFAQPAGHEPLAVTVGLDGNIYVGGAPHGRPSSRAWARWDTVAVTRVTPDLVADTIFSIGGTESLYGLYAWRDKLVVVLSRPWDELERSLGYAEEQVVAREELLLVTYDGMPAKAFHPEDERKHGVPYWREWFGTYAAAAGNDLLVVNSLYPVYRYGPEGELADTFGSASASFRQPSRPEQGAFPAWGALYEWLSSFTTIDGVHVVADSLVVVVLEDRSADEPAMAERSYRADVYDLRSGDVVARDVGLEGRVLHADTLLYVAWRPTGKGWHVGLFELEPTSSPCLLRRAVFGIF